MKKIIITAIGLAVLIACNNESKSDKVEKSSEAKEEKSAETPITENPDYTRDSN
jgi:hypothetical protein